MELFFLAVLILLMIAALSSGFPVAFALPGSAIGAIALAALCGWLFEGNADAYFAQGGAIEWLSAGVTNFRSLYWDVERDTLIAIPLFVFMGIMLQRSKIAEDLLVSMAQLFGPIPGGLGISVVFVGALLAATTGIVGATVIAMGLISLPAMLRNNYSKPLATGTICASGTLGQIIPPSIVLIILADQLSSAADQASTTRKADFKAATGEFSLPSEFDIVSASAGDMFMGAFIPGLLLVAIYMLYILVSAILRPKTAPPVPYDGKYDREFIKSVVLALVPPLTLIFAVLGSIVLGIATVNQAGAIGAIGAMIMAGYRLAANQRNTYTPAVIAIVSIVVIFIVLGFFNINIKNIRGTKDLIGIVLASIGATGLMVSVVWSGWRAYKIEDTLNGVMLETAKTTSMVFIILIGAAMLTSAFRAFGGEELVKHFLLGLPGGFWTQFIVVMIVIFLLGFFLDFIEIAVVVVPIVAPILLSDPAANVTAVWFGVMVGLNIQTSFLTPPFGFALFYLRGVAPPDVRTTDIYRGAAAFILLQLTGLAVAGTFPSLVNYLPNRIYLTSETAPPPQNPRLQACLEEHLFEYYDENGDTLRSVIQKAQGLDISYLPEQRRNTLGGSYEKALDTFEKVKQVRAAEAAVDAYAPDYRPLHVEVRDLEVEMRKIVSKLEGLEQERVRLTRSDDPPKDRIEAIGKEIEALKAESARLKDSIPPDWTQKRKGYTDLAKAEKLARFGYRRNVDEAYEPVAKILGQIEQADKLAGIEPRLAALAGVISGSEPEPAMESIQEVERLLNELDGASDIVSPLSKARREFRVREGEVPNRESAAALLAEAQKEFAAELEWRKRAAKDLAPGLTAYDDALRASIGLRLQKRLTTAQAKEVAECLSHHRDISLNF